MDAATLSHSEDKGQMLRAQERMGGILTWTQVRFTNLWRAFTLKVSGTQSCSTVCDPMGCSLPGSSVHGISQARILEWVPIPFSRRLS